VFGEEMEDRNALRLAAEMRASGDMALAMMRRIVSGFSG